MRTYMLPRRNVNSNRTRHAQLGRLRRWQNADGVRQPDVTLHKALLGRAEWTIHEQSGLPVTTAARTVADLARAGNEASHLGDLIQDAAHLGLVTQLELVVSLSGLEASLGFGKGAARDVMEWCEELGVPR